MTVAGFLSQLLQLAIALALAPLLVGWINKCRAWLSNRTAPSILLPYRMIRKLFFKDAVVAQNASPIFRLTPYIVFGAMCCAAAIVPSLATDLPFGRGRGCDRPRRPVRARTRVHGAGRDGHRHVFRLARRAAGNVRRLPRGAGAADGALHGVADQRVDVAAVDRRHVRPPGDRDLPQPRVRRRRLHDGVAGRKRAHSRWTIRRPTSS